jgi:hypothetical protein
MSLDAVRQALCGKYVVQSYSSYYLREFSKCGGLDAGDALNGKGGGYG